jgi:hypothetical protein
MTTQIRHPKDDHYNASFIHPFIVVIKKKERKSAQGPYSDPPAPAAAAAEA